LGSIALVDQVIYLLSDHLGKMPTKPGFPARIEAFAYFDEVKQTKGGLPDLGAA
jgi:hypothetical protein